MGYALTQLSVNDSSEGKSFEQLYKLYKGTISKLELCAKHVPGNDNQLDEDYERQEALLMQVQDDVIRHAATRPVHTVEDAEGLAALWQLLTGPDADECSQVTNQLARKLVSFRQAYG